MFSHRNASIYVALVVWGLASFMAQPTFASLVVHLACLPIALAVLIWVAHMEGRKI